MKNLKIATWDMKEFNLEQIFYHKELKAITLLDFLRDEKPDVVALQNVDRKIAMMVNEKFQEFPEFGYYFDRLKKEEYGALDRLLDNERNPIIMRNDCLSISDQPVNINGLFINKTYLTDRNAKADKFCLVNANYTDLGIDYNLDILANAINVDDFGTSDRKTPIIVTGRIDLGLCSDEMLKLRKTALDLNRIRIEKCLNKGNRYNYLMLNDFTVDNCECIDEYKVSDMCKPLVAEMKMK